MIGAVNAEVFNPIAQRLKRESPFKATMTATLTNRRGPLGPHPLRQAHVHLAQLGLRELSIVNGAIDGARKGEVERKKVQQMTHRRVSTTMVGFGLAVGASLSRARRRPATPT